MRFEPVFKEKKKILPEVTGPYCSFVGVTITGVVGSVGQNNGALAGRERITGKQIE